VTWPWTNPDGGSRYRIAKSGLPIVGSLNEYWKASVPAAFSMPSVAEPPCSRELASMFRYYVRICPFS
jgi:hypothetical protein